MSTLTSDDVLATTFLEHTVERFKMYEKKLEDHGVKAARMAGELTSSKNEVILYVDKQKASADAFDRELHAIREENKTQMDSFLQKFASFVLGSNVTAIGDRVRAIEKKLVPKKLRNILVLLCNRVSKMEDSVRVLVDEGEGGFMEPWNDLYD